MFIINEKPWDVDTEVEFVHIEDTVGQMELCSHHCRQFEELFQGVMMMDLPKRAAAVIALRRLLGITLGVCWKSYPCRAQFEAVEMDDKTASGCLHILYTVSTLRDFLLDTEGASPSLCSLFATPFGTTQECSQTKSPSL